jgi:tetratricopeptide (TPR) repeat protein
VPAPGGEAGFDSREALADLYAYSLASPAEAVDGQMAGPAFVVHRLVQDFTQRGLDETPGRVVLEQALGRVNAAFAGDPGDVRNWPLLDPLAPHALAVVGRSDEAGIPEPTARLMNELGVLFATKARYREAEPLYRRALAIDEASRGPDHPNVATRLNNLALLLRDTNRLAEAEPLYQRALTILIAFEHRTGHQHPNRDAGLLNYRSLLVDLDRSEAEISSAITAITGGLT